MYKLPAFPSFSVVRSLSLTVLKPTFSPCIHCIGDQWVNKTLMNYVTGACWWLIPSWIQPRAIIFSVRLSGGAWIQLSITGALFRTIDSNLLCRDLVVKGDYRVVFWDNWYDVWRIFWAARKSRTVLASIVLHLVRDDDFDIDFLIVRKSVKDAVCECWSPTYNSFGRHYYWNGDVQIQLQGAWMHDVWVSWHWGISWLVAVIECWHFRVIYRHNEQATAEGQSEAQRRI